MNCQYKKNDFVEIGVIVELFVNVLYVEDATTFYDIFFPESSEQLNRTESVI